MVASLLAALVAGSAAYCILVVIAARSYMRQPYGELAGEPVSILKPLSGADDGLEENLRSFFEQPYPEFEILAAVRTAEDAAAAVFTTLQREYSAVASRLLITGEPPYANAKVFSLSNMIREARHELIVMSDSDIRVGPAFLRSIAAEFTAPNLGLATCPYRAIAGARLWSRLEAEGMNTEFLGGLLVARLLMGVDFAVGPTLVARRRVLEAIGFEQLKEYLAEDFVLGRLAAESGAGVILSRTIVEHRIGSERFLLNASHRLRWFRSTRRSRPAGYVGQIFTNSLPFIVALAMLRPSWWPYLLAAAGLRALAAWATSSRILGKPVNWVLLPFQDLLSFFFWIAGFFGNTISWRGRRYYLRPDGRFEPVA